MIAWVLLEPRIPGAPRFGYALAIVFLAGISDWLDGFAARRLKSSGSIGAILDPLADKVLLITLFMSLGLAHLIPMWILFLVIGRDLVIVFGALLVRVFRNVRKFAPSEVGKVSTFFQIVLVLLVLLYAALPFAVFLWLKYTALALCAFFTALSGFDYVRLGVKMARRDPSVLP